MIVKGKCSTFGGPSDSGVKPTEGLGLISTVRERNKHLFLNFVTVGEKALARSLNPKACFAAMRLPVRLATWTMATCGLNEEVSYWSQFRLLIRHPDTGKVVMAELVDTGPAQWTRRIVDFSPGVAEAIGATTDHVVEVALLGTREEWPVLLEPDQAKRLWEQRESVRSAMTVISAALNPEEEVVE